MHSHLCALVCVHWRRSCMCARVRALVCVRSCVCACVCALLCVRLCVGARVRASEPAMGLSFQLVFLFYSFLDTFTNLGHTYRYF